MSALPQQNFSTQYYAPQPYPKKLDNPQIQVNKVLRTNTFTQSQTLPHNLKILALLQKASFGVALASMSASMGLYISTVRIPELWSEKYQNLENLQRQERQLIAINETMKYQIAQAASKDRRLNISTPESALFITPAKIKNQSELAANTNQQSTVKLQHNTLGY